MFSELLPSNKLAEFSPKEKSSPNLLGPENQSSENTDNQLISKDFGELLANSGNLSSPLTEPNSPKNLGQMGTLEPSEKNASFSETGDTDRLKTGYRGSLQNLDEFDHNIISKLNTHLKNSKNNIPSSNIENLQNPNLKGLLSSKLNRIDSKEYSLNKPSEDIPAASPNIDSAWKKEEEINSIIDGENLASGVPILSILSRNGGFSKEPSKVVQTISQNPFLNQILTSKDILSSFYGADDSSKLLKNVLGAAELEGPWKDLISNLPNKISNFELIGKLGFDADSIKNEIIALKEALPFEGITRFLSKTIDPLPTNSKELLDKNYNLSASAVELKPEQLPNSIENFSAGNRFLETNKEYNQKTFNSSLKQNLESSQFPQEEISNEIKPGFNFAKNPTIPRSNMANFVESKNQFIDSTKYVPKQDMPSLEATSGILKSNNQLNISPENPHIPTNGNAYFGENKYQNLENNVTKNSNSTSILQPLDLDKNIKTGNSLGDLSNFLESEVIRPEGIPSIFSQNSNQNFDSSENSFFDILNPDQDLFENMNTKSLNSKIVSHSISLSESGGGVANININSKELGKIDVQISVQNNKVDLQIVASTADVKDQIEAELPMLTEAFRKESLQPQSLEVKIEESQNFSEQYSKQNQDQNSDSYQDAKRDREFFDSPYKTTENKAIVPPFKPNIRPISHGGSIQIRA